MSTADSSDPEIQFNVVDRAFIVVDEIDGSDNESVENTITSKPASLQNQPLMSPSASMEPQSGVSPTGNIHTGPSVSPHSSRVSISSSGRHQSTEYQPGRNQSSLSPSARYQCGDPLTECNPHSEFSSWHDEHGDHIRSRSTKKKQHSMSPRRRQRSVSSSGHHNGHRTPSRSCRLNQSTQSSPSRPRNSPYRRRRSTSNSNGRHQPRYHSNTSRDRYDNPENEYHHSRTHSRNRNRDGSPSEWCRRRVDRSHSRHYEHSYRRSPSFDRNHSNYYPGRMVDAYDPNHTELDYGHRPRPTRHHNTTVPGMKPEPYNGDEPWEEYFSHFENCALLGQWSYSNRALILAASLRGQARLYYMSLDIRQQEDYQMLVSQMKHRFGSSVHAGKWLNLLESRQRQQGESITALCDDLRQLTKKAYYQLDSKAQDVIALNQLYKLVSVDVKCRCIDRDCTTLQEAAAVIDRYEAIVGQSNGKPAKSNIRAIDTNGIEPDIATILQKLDSRLEVLEKATKLENKQKDQDEPNKIHKRNERRCFTCNSTQHLYKECPNKRKNQYHGYSNNTRNNNYSRPEAYPSNECSQSENWRMSGQ